MTPPRSGASPGCGEAQGGRFPTTVAVPRPIDRGAAAVTYLTPLEVRRVDRMTCNQPLLIHANGSATCAVTGCLDHLTLGEAVQQHRHVVNCRAVLGTRCPLCRVATDAPAAATSSEAVGDPGSMCRGVAIAHVDLSFECSSPGCRVDKSRGAWLARHDEIVSCGNLSVGCSLCSISDDRGSPQTV
jgi:hypothetical protein